MFEAVVARHEHRAVHDLYHSALEVRLGENRWVIEMTPVWADKQPDRGVVLEGPVGARWLGRSAVFRYEIRRWADGVIPDVEAAVASPRAVSRDPEAARRLLALVPQVPALTWGRDEMRTGEMWNSNSLTAWLLAGSGHGMAAIEPPAGGRAPGWSAGLALAVHPGPRAVARRVRPRSRGDAPTLPSLGPAHSSRSARSTPTASTAPGVRRTGSREHLHRDNACDNR
jgi:hypothetical protein